MMIPLRTLVFLLVSLSACFDDYSEAPKEQGQKTEKGRRFLKTTTRGLRVRFEPSLGGFELERLPTDAILEYFNDSTQFKTRITVGGIPIEHNWLKIKAPSGNEGWVYSGFTRFLSDADNRKIVLSQKKLPKQKNTSKINNGATQSSKLKANLKQPVELDKKNSYRHQLQQLEKSKLGAVQEAVVLYESTFQEANKTTCDAGFVLFQEFYNQSFEIFKQKDWSRYRPLVKQLETYGSANMTVDETTIALQQNGFRFGIAIANSQITLKRDIEFILRRFYRYVSPIMQVCLDKAQKKLAGPYVRTERLAILPEKLADCQ